MGNTVALLTDFGYGDSFVGVMKGVIASLDNSLNVIDISHDILPQDIGQGAFVLDTSYSYFPKGTVFCCVVDPGVGSDRKAICIKTKNYYFVGPDNGLMYAAAENDGIVKIIELNEEKYFLDKVSLTFHGRDIFAPISAHIAAGLDVELLGPETQRLVEFRFPVPKEEDGELRLKMLHVDSFGNIVLNIQETEFKNFCADIEFELTISNIVVNKLCRHYTEVEEGELFVIIGSNGYLEISARNADAADILNVELGDIAILREKNAQREE